MWYFWAHSSVPVAFWVYSGGQNCTIHLTNFLVSYRRLTFFFFSVRFTTHWSLASLSLYDRASTISSAPGLFWIMTHSFLFMVVLFMASSLKEIIPYLTQRVVGLPSILLMGSSPQFDIHWESLYEASFFLPDLVTKQHFQHQVKLFRD